MNTWIAIHEDDEGFSRRWAEYCTERGIAFRYVNCLSNTIITDLDGAAGLLWHWQLFEPAYKVTALGIIQSLEKRGLPVYPNSNTCWHYDDKLGQKYLLESIKAPLVQTYVFYDLDSALEWVRSTTFPKVVKLRCGAGSAAVRMVRTRSQAVRVCKTAFSAGFPSNASYFIDFSTRVRKIRGVRDALAKIKRMPGEFKFKYVERIYGPRERHYVYFQEFIPDNDFDTRITIIGDRAFGFRRFVRPKDFRASGSGNIDYDPRAIGPDLIQIAFDIIRKIGAQSLAFDFVRDQTGEAKLLEISYAFVGSVLTQCPGYWDCDLNWIAGSYRPEDLIMDDFLRSLHIGS